MYICFWESPINGGFQLGTSSIIREFRVDWMPPLTVPVVFTVAVATSSDLNRQ